MKGTFATFVRQVEREWRVGLPTLRKIEQSYGPSLRKSSTFYAGSSNRLGKHLFIAFQHNSMPWAVGEFTVNVIVSNRLGAPSLLGPGLDLAGGAEGNYRLGQELHGKDKWWCLLPTDNVHGLVWKARSYEDQAAVFQAALADVTADVRAFLSKLDAA